MNLADRLGEWNQENSIAPDRWRNRRQAETVFSLIRYLQQTESRSAQDRDTYLACCQQLPRTLRRSGLAKTLGWPWALQQEAALKTPDIETPEYEFLAHLALCLWPWLRQFEPATVAELPPVHDPKKLVEQLLNCAEQADLPDYLVLTRLTRILLDDFKQFGQILLNDLTG